MKSSYQNPHQNSQLIIADIKSHQSLKPRDLAAGAELVDPGLFFRVRQKQICYIAYYSSKNPQSMTPLRSPGIRAEGFDGVLLQQVISFRKIIQLMRMTG